MLSSFGKHALFDLTVRVEGDLHIDAHHTVEDTAIALGQAFAQAAGDKSGTRRFGDAMIPMDECLVQAAVDLSGRPYLVHNEPAGAPPTSARTTPPHSPGTCSSRSSTTRRLRCTSPCTRAATGTTSPRRSTRRSRVRCAPQSNPTRACRRAVDQGRALAPYEASRRARLRVGQSAVRAARVRARRREVVGHRRRRAAVEADGLVVPGVGAFAACMAGLAQVDGAADDHAAARRAAPGARHLRRHAGAVRRWCRARRRDRGLGVLPGRVERLRAPVARTWGGTPSTRPPGSTLFAGLDADTRFYFVHSYAAHHTSGAGVDTVHGEPFVAAVEDGLVSATQFHPEKSGDAGAALLENWVRAL